MSREIPPSGSLKDFAFSDVLTYLKEKESTGILTCENGHVEKNIYVERGDVVFAESNQMNDRLGEHLVKTHKITPEQLEESLERSREEQKRHGETLLELGYLLPKNLFIELRNQLSGIIYSLFAWDEGNFDFQEMSSLSDIIGLRMNTGQLVREGLKRTEEEKREEERLFLQEVEDIYEKIDILTFYDVLNLTMDASFPEIKKSYLRMVQRYHPDRHRSATDHALEKKLTRVFGSINEAYQTLSSERERAQYDAKLLGIGPKKVHRKDTEIVHDHFHRGITEFNKGNYWGAAENFQWVTQRQPGNAHYWAHLSFALSKIPRKKKAAEGAIKKAIDLEPHNADYYVHLGLIYLKAGLTMRAEKQFHAALNWDPTHERAQMEIQRLGGGR